VTIGPDYFDDLYDQHDDPWGFQNRWYERRKRQLTMAAVPGERYRSIFEPGCSIGVLTAELATRSDRVLAMDISAKALARARDRVPPTVELCQGAVPGAWPAGTFDLVVLSEVGYYLDSTDCQRMAELAVTSAHDLVAVHWLHPVNDYPLTGDQVHQIINTCADRHHMTRIATHLETDLRIDVWSKDSRSVAATTGIVNS
jgi:SAM-dependent methyltransferase